ncbi:3-deoxy-D-manno-octulosonic acid transferase [Desulfosarcina alkanivorans]|uniref:3-deoxy-D-manno-octulosonic acid transferase n=1 Tax=Desulfosarcina alkanivorans TaxID=571177 RepID=A0A5K7YL08_9BACT|nr:3-deoxy-D-manno-octulosonic acid transferase [Desulfosarcina alkanivorans]BBO67501.1 3-deoxy-D-manno-octulosonic acid transferase [Desulfosarcina alkanivorans]
MIIGYNVVMVVAILLLWPIWVPVVGFRKKHRRTFLKRLFMEALPRNDTASGDAGGPVWIHALSVGEVLSAEPLVKALAQKIGGHRLVFTASTQTGYEMATRVMAPHVAAIRHFPYDTPFSVRRALTVVGPRLVVIVETDIWPNFLYSLNRCKIPVHLVNARLSDGSFRGYKRIGFLMSPLLSLFERICVQTDSDRFRFLELGVSEKKLATVGNIKFDQAPVSVSAEDLNRLSEGLCLSESAPVWVAGSTHQGEEAVLSDAYRSLRATGIDAVLIVVPRDPGRAIAVCSIFRRSGVDARTMGQIERQPSPSAVVVIDRIGVLRQLYALADVAFVGGSLVDAGGHNPLEPASVAKPILFGPHTSDFRWICQTLENEGGAIRVDDAHQLAGQAGHLMVNRDANRRVGQRARDVFIKNRGAVERTLAVIGSDIHP